MAKAFIVRAAHWSNPGIRAAVAVTREAANIAAAGFVDDLVADFRDYAARSGDDGGALDYAPSLPASPSTWSRSLTVLQLARLIDYEGGEGEANDVLFSAPLEGVPDYAPLISIPLLDATLEAMDTYAQEDEDENGVGFPQVWIEETDLVDSPAPAPIAALTTALRHASGALSACEHQIGQMSGMFPDEDGTIQDAVDAADDSREEIEAVLAGLPAKPIRILIALDGGLVQGGCSDVPVDVTIVDYDVEGADEADLTDVPQDDGTTARAAVGGETFSVDPAFIDAAIAASKRN
jgi:hypothetical protein